MSARFGIGVGSSGPRARAFVDEAILVLRSAQELRVLAESDRFASAPVGGATEAPFVNAAVFVESPLSPRALLSFLHATERRFGRVRGARFGGRSLDLDVLWAEGAASSEPALQVPHPRLPERSFALLPLVEALTRAGTPVPLVLLAQARALGAVGLRRLPRAA